MGPNSQYFGGKVRLTFHSAAHRTDNMIKNQFYSTLRRQLRKINKILLSETFQNQLGGKTVELSIDELYKYIKEDKVDYDDIKGIYQEALTAIDSDKVEEFKLQAAEEVKTEKQSEVINDRYNRRSYRLSQKQKSSDSEKPDLTKIGVLVLFKTLRLYREQNQHNLPRTSSNNS